MGLDQAETFQWMRHRILKLEELLKNESKLAGEWELRWDESQRQLLELQAERLEFLNQISVIAVALENELDSSDGPTEVLAKLPILFRETRKDAVKAFRARLLALQQENETIKANAVRVALGTPCLEHIGINAPSFEQITEWSGRCLPCLIKSVEAFRARCLAKIDAIDFNRTSMEVSIDRVMDLIESLPAEVEKDGD